MQNTQREVSGWLAEVTRSLQSKTGFKGGEIFRKYLWYLLRERKFDQEAVNDVVYLKSVLNLNEDQVRHFFSRFPNKFATIMGMHRFTIPHQDLSKCLGI